MLRIVTALVLAAADASGLWSHELESEAARSRADFHQRLDALRAAHAGSLPSLEESIARLCPEVSPEQRLLFLPAMEFHEAFGDAGSSVGEMPESALEEICRDQGKKLVTLARRALGAEEPYLSLEFLWEALHVDPNNVIARKMLGFVRYQERWHRPYAVQRLRMGQVWHPRFGWILRKHVDRYEAGQRYVGGRWLSAEEDSRGRTDIRRGWRVESEHYSVLTNHSLEAGVRLVRDLELLHEVWQRVFVGYVVNKRELTEMLQSSNGFRPRPRRHEVVYFRTRDEYNAALRRSQPRIDITLGIYFDQERKAYFFAGADQDEGTLYHEATHQLFQENLPAESLVARHANFWIVEGIACYMESLRHHAGFATLGGYRAGRMPAARQRLLDDGYYIPLEELTTLGMAELQARPDIPMIYSQSAGLATFLMHYDGGRYRDALFAYLRDVYSGRDDPGSLARRAGVRYADLDYQYRQFLRGVLDPTKADSPVTFPSE